MLADQAHLIIVEIKDRVVLPHERISKNPEVSRPKAIDFDVAHIILAIDKFVGWNFVIVGLSQCDGQAWEVCHELLVVGTLTSILLIKFIV